MTLLGCTNSNNFTYKINDLGGEFGLISTPLGPLARVRWPVHAGAAQVLVIEGDGYAYVEANRPSANPTPRNAVGLEVAMAAHAYGQNAIYLARPGQWGTAKNYRYEDWTIRRFSGHNIAAQVQAVQHLRGAEKPVLVGYSGGAAIARVAAQNPNVQGLISIAGNLNPNATNAHHGIPPFAKLDESLRGPVSFPPRVPVLLVQGSTDNIIPPLDVPNTPCLKTLTLEANHAKLNNGQPWASVWPHMWLAWQGVQASCQAATKALGTTSKE